MNSRILYILGNIASDYRRIERCLVVTKSSNKQKRTSSKSKLKQTKPVKNNKYNTSKPMKSKSVNQFRNKSNI
jgi:hypothetical protein